MVIHSKAKAEKYGSVYTPDTLADFVAQLICDEMSPNASHINVLDPACGELSLLAAICRSKLDSSVDRYIGVDFDGEAISNCKDIAVEFNQEIELIESDFICPKKSRGASANWWIKHDVKPDVVISNPPWSGDKIYDRARLSRAGITLAEGQYDSYVLFIDLCMQLLAENGIAGFILPDSLFSASNEPLRRYIASNYQIALLARLGEKLFPDVHRATTVLIVRKSRPMPESITKCFRLNTRGRRSVLKGESSFADLYKRFFHSVHQSRFVVDPLCRYDIDTREGEEVLIDAICKRSIEGSSLFTFNRGVEISKNGLLVCCPNCGNYQGVTKKQIEKSSKKCQACGKSFNPANPIFAIESEPSEGTEKIIVGEDMARYELRGVRHIKIGLKGVSYKSNCIYEKPKILVRKTGLGINAALDLNGTMVTQTVYMLSFKNDAMSEDLYWYYLSILNSRVVFYLYLKRFGEIEWKSHPYLTKSTLLSLPLLNHVLIDHTTIIKIGRLGQKLQSEYSHELDVELEMEICKAYELTAEQIDMIRTEMNNMPDLSSINRMKY